MKRAILVLVLIGSVIGGSVYWMKSRRGGDTKPVDEKPVAEESRVKHDEKGRVVIKMDDETQGNIGLLVAKPAAAQLSPEVKGYGRVLDPTSLAALVTESATARAAYAASSNELARLTTLAGQGNASERALQTAEATALRDHLSVQSAQDRLVLSWGKGIADRNDLPAFIRSLTSQDAVLVRIDLPAGETLKSLPHGARISTLSGDTSEAKFLDAASHVDPQTLGQGYIFIVTPNELRLLSGEAVTGYLNLPGESLTGAIIPREAIVRTEGAGWVYVLDSGSEAFTRIEVALDHPTGTGWLVTKGVTTNDYIVVTGAQILLSEELKSSIKAD